MKSRRPLRLVAAILLFPAFVILLTTGVTHLFKRDPVEALPGRVIPEAAKQRIDTVNRAFEANWSTLDFAPAPEADDLTVMRRLALALTGAAPSLEEIRMLETLPPGADPVQSYLDHLFADPRYHHYFAERLARAFVGIEPGPFLVYRRRRLVNWLAGELAANRPYDAMVRDLIAAEGIWTTSPATNFLTATLVQGGDNKGPDEIKLAARTSRAFLGISLDCMQCHDDKFGDHWKQEHFHELAAFFAQAEMSLTGVREKPGRQYEVAYLGKTDPEPVDAAVPFQSELLPESGHRRARLARWITHGENRTFARAAVNRTWALLAGRPLYSPVDEIPLHGPFPVGMEELTDFFLAEKHDYRALIRIIAASTAYRRASASGDPATPVTQAQESAWAAFPITPLRSEQVAGSVIQAASLQTLDGEVHILTKLRRFGETTDFVKRYGDQGENEFAEEAGTIPQRLLLLNGKLVSERTGPNPILNSATRIAHYAPSDAKALEAAFLATLTRQPNEKEQDHFLPLLTKAREKARERAMEDIFWALINSTEFSWNR